MSVDANTSTTSTIEAAEVWNKIIKATNPKLEESTENQPNQSNTENHVTPTMVFSVIGDSDSLVPRPWPTTLFQTALIEAAKSGGETWIVFRKNEEVVSKVIQEAYQHYEVMELRKDEDKSFGNPNRHIKLINISGKQENANSTNNSEVYDVDIGKQENQLLKFEKYISKQEVSFSNPKMKIKMPVPIAIIVCEGDLRTVVHIAKALEENIPVIIMKGSGKAADLVLDYIDKNDEFRKKASISFGIQFDNDRYELLEKHLKEIITHKDLVGVFDLDRDDPLKLSNIVGETVVSCWSIKHVDPSQKNAQGAVTNGNTQCACKCKVETPQQQVGSGKLTHQQYVNDRQTTFPEKSRTPPSLEEYNMIDSDNKKTEETSKKTNQRSPEYGPPLKGLSLTIKFLRKNSVSPQDVKFEGFNMKSRTHILNPKYSTPTSLPLYFYFVYQLLQEEKKIKQYGPTLLLEALKANRCDYVRVLLTKGVELERNIFPELYRQTVACQGCKKEDPPCLHIQWILEQLDEDETKIIFLEETKGKTVDEAAKALCRTILRYEKCTQCDNNENHRSCFSMSVKKKASVMKEDTSTISDILLWAIFANRKEIAEICWLRSENHLLTGLVCSAILKKLSKKANNVKEQVLSNDLEEHSKMFEQRCIALMNSMYNENAKEAIDLMDDDAHVWGIHSSPLTFAYENFMYDVVAHTCSQKNMNKQWYKDLPPDLKPFLQSAFEKPRKFFTAPLTKYVFNYMMFFTMLFMYSAFVLTSIGTEYYVQDIARVFEYYVYFWGAGDLIEELISCFGCMEDQGRSHRSYYRRMKRYFNDFWNVVDLLSYVLLIAALCVRHFHLSQKFTVARRMFSLSVLVMYLRFLEVFLIHRKLGPTLIMIKEMLKDLLGFLSIAVFVVLGVGIYFHANLWPDHQTIWNGDWTNWRLWTIIYYPYWQLYGELNLNYLEGNGGNKCTNVPSEWESDTSKERCPQEDWTVQAVAAFYLLFSNLLLVNLVIAMFSYTFERVQENSEKLWRFERYTVINDYKWRIPSPINLVFLPYRFFCCLTNENSCLYRCKKNSCCRKEGTNNNENNTNNGVNNTNNGVNNTDNGNNTDNEGNNTNNGGNNTNNGGNNTNNENNTNNGGNNTNNVENNTNNGENNTNNGENNTNNGEKNTNNGGNNTNNGGNNTTNGGNNTNNGGNNTNNGGNNTNNGGNNTNNGGNNTNNGEKNPNNGGNNTNNEENNNVVFRKNFQKIIALRNHNKI